MNPDEGSRSSSSHQSFGMNLSWPSTLLVFVIFWVG
jgi:hypothetical protein